MLRYVVRAAKLLLPVLVVGCGSYMSDGSTTPPPEAGLLAAPPPPVPNAPPPDGTDHVFAWRETFLGDKDWSGNGDPSAWKKFGYDVDGLPAGSRSCLPVAGTPATQSAGDGADGLDNSWGANVMPIVLGLTSDASGKIACNCEPPHVSKLLRAEKLGSGSSYSSVSAALFDTGDLGAAPRWDGTDAWPVLYESVANGDVGDPVVQWSNSYVASRTWVSGGFATLTIPVEVSGYYWGITIRRAVLSMDLAPDSASATHGIVAGILDAKELLASFTLVAGKISSSLCAGSTLDSILAQIARASDVMSDGSHAPAGTCNGISIGIGFTAGAAKIGAVLPPAVKGADPCAGVVCAGDGG